MKRGIEIEKDLDVGSPVLCFLDPLDRGRSVTGHVDDHIDADSMFQAGFLARKRYGSSTDPLVDVCLLRECDGARTQDYFEYMVEPPNAFCEFPLTGPTGCGTGRPADRGGPCYRRHAEINVPITALRAGGFRLVPIDPEAQAAARAAAIVPRIAKAAFWRVPAGARQEALRIIAQDEKDGVNAA